MADIAGAGPDGIPFRVMTWNVRGSARPRIGVLAAVVGAHDPDVLALQEVQQHQARRLAAALGGRGVHWLAKHRPPFLPGVLGRRWTEGLAVLARHRVLDHATATLTDDDVPFSSFRRRVAQQVVLDVDGRSVRVVNVHLSSDSADARAAQTGRLVEFVDGPFPGSGGDRGRTVLAGDLNTDAERAVFAPLAATGLFEAWPAVGNGAGSTNPAHAPTQRLDHVLAAAAFVPVRAAVVTSPEAAGSSDHLPVVVDYLLQ